MKKNKHTYIFQGILLLIAIAIFYFPSVSKAITSERNILNDGSIGVESNINNNATINETRLPDNTPICTITSITSDAPANTITEWNTTRLSWVESNCTTLTLSSSDGTYTNTSVLGQTSIETIPIGQTTSFLLVGTDTNGTVVQKPITITVSSSDTTINSCQIYSFSANGSNNIQVTNGQYATLSWSTSDGCTNVSISGSNGVYFSGQPNTSNMNVGPFVSTVTYTLNATDASGTNISNQVTVTVYTPNNNYNNNYYNYGNNTNNCVITNFIASPTYISSGQTTNLSWSTAGCSSVSITSSGNTSLSNGYYLPANGSIQTNPIYGTLDLILTASGNNSTSWPPLTIYVTGGSYSYNNSQNNSGSNAITSIATNVGPYSARLNGIFTQTYSPLTAWFEYGIDSSLGSTSATQNFSGQTTSGFNAVIYTNPSTTYFYRAVTELNGVISRGDIMSFVSKDQSDTTIYTQNTNTTTNATTTTTPTDPTATGVFLSITNQGDKVAIGDTVEYQIDYINNTTKTLKNVLLNISLPQGFNVVQTTQGQVTSPTLINVDLKTLTPGQKGSLFMQATVGSNVSLTNTLVTNGALSFTYPNGVSDSAVGYVLNHASGGVSSLGGFALGSGFFPTTVIGWLVTILIILAVILTIRRIAKAKKPSGIDVHH